MCLKKVTLKSTEFKEKLKTLLLQFPYLSDRQNTTHIADSYGIIRQQCTGSSTGRPQKLTSVQKGTDRQKHTKRTYTPHWNQETTKLVSEQAIAPTNH